MQLLFSEPSLFSYATVLSRAILLLLCNCPSLSHPAPPLHPSFSKPSHFSFAPVLLQAILSLLRNCSSPSHPAPPMQPFFSKPPRATPLRLCHHTCNIDRPSVSKKTSWIYRRKATNTDMNVHAGSPFFTHHHVIANITMTLQTSPCHCKHRHVVANIAMSLQTSPCRCKHRHVVANIAMSLQTSPHRHSCH